MPSQLQLYAERFSLRGAVFLIGENCYPTPQVAAEALGCQLAITGEEVDCLSQPCALWSFIKTDGNEKERAHDLKGKSVPPPTRRARDPEKVSSQIDEILEKKDDKFEDDGSEMRTRRRAKLGLEPLPEEGEAEDGSEDPVSRWGDLSQVSKPQALCLLTPPGSYGDLALLGYFRAALCGHRGMLFLCGRVCPSSRYFR
eukprot:symbB.v1.2.039243.t1/scaffold6437.1/size18120/1